MYHLRLAHKHSPFDRIGHSKDAACKGPNGPLLFIINEIKWNCRRLFPMENLTRHDMAVTLRLRPRCELVCHKTLLEYCEHVQFSNFPSSTMANICSIDTAGCCRPRDESQHPHRPHFMLWERVQLHHSDVNAEVDSKYMICFCIQLALFCLSVGCD